MPKLTRTGVEIIYAVAERFVDECLRQDGSLFTPGTSVWNSRNADELYERFVLAPDISGGRFDEKFQRQLTDATAGTVQFAAELIYVHFLIADEIGGAAKRRLVEEVLSWLPTQVRIPQDLDAALETGLVTAGVAFKSHRHAQISFFVEFVRAWKQLTVEARNAALADPWNFKAVVSSVPIHAGYAQRRNGPAGAFGSPSRRRCSSTLVLSLVQADCPGPLTARLLSAD